MTVQTIVVGDIQTNCYIIEDGGEAAVIDAGGDVAAIVTALPVPPKYVFATHGHFDHVLAVPELLREFPAAKFYMHDADKDFRGITGFVPAREIAEIHTYKEGDRLALGDAEVEVLETPGHSKGSVTLKVADSLFTGDTLFFETCGRVDFPGGNIEEMLRSLRKLSELKGGASVFPGHGEETTLKHERRNNRYMREGV